MFWKILKKSRPMKKQLQCLFFLTLFFSYGSAAQVTFTAQSSTVNCEANNLSIDIIVDNFTNMNSFQYTINWDPNVLSQTSFSNNNNGVSLGSAQLANGFSQVSWFSTGSGGFTNLSNGATLFTINFDLIGNASSAIISFDGNPSPIEVIQGGAPIGPSQYAFNNGTISFTDSTNPVASCPSDITVNAGGASSTLATGVSPSGTDNCAIELYNYTLSGATTGAGTGDVSSTVNFNLGTTTVEYTAVDYGGNTSNCSFNVTAENSITSTELEIFGEQVSINCINNTASVDIIANNFTNLKGAQFTLNWNAAALQYIDTSNIVFTNGVSFGGNNTSGVLTFSWFNSTPVSFSNNQVLFTLNFSLLNAQAGLSEIIPFVNTPTFIQFVDENNNAVPSSDYTLTNGLVTIFDNSPPTITCPNNVNLDAGTGSSVVVNNLAPTTTDNCGISNTSFTLSGATTGSGIGDASGTTFNLGTTTVEYTATDFGGNSVSCSFLVTVVVDPIQLITVEIDSLDLICNNNSAEVCIRLEDFNDIRGIQFTINWNDSELQYIDTSNVNLSNSNFGINNVASGLLTYSWFSTGAPVSLPDGTSLFCINFDLINPSGGDSYNINFSNAPTPVQISTQSSLPNFLPVSEYVIANGNIMLSPDNQPPTLTCPTDVTVNAGGLSSIPVNGLAPTSSDDCGTPTVTFELTGATTGTGNNDASSLLYNLGVTTVTYTATDGTGNSETCSFNVTVTNDPAQVISINIDSLILGCNDKTAEVCIRVNNFEDIRGVQFTINWNDSELTYIDTSNVSLANSNFGINNVASGVMTYSWFSGGTPITLADGTSIFCLNFDLVNPVPPASYDITFSNFPTPVQVTTQASLPNPLPITDYVISNGNIVILADTQAPTLTCPMDVTVDAGTAASIAVNGLAPSASDDCGTPSVTYVLTGATTGTGSNDASSLLYNTGVTTVTYTATDGSGNSTECSLTVTVETNASNVIDVNLDSLTLNCGLNTAELCVRVDNFVDVRGIQFTINWDPNELIFDNTSQVVLSNPSFGTNNASTGTMTFSWFSSSSPVTLSDGSAIFCINFTLVSPTPGNDFDVNFDFNGSTPFQIITQSSLPNILPPSSYTTTNGNIQIPADTQAPTIECPDDVTINSNGAPSVIVNNIAPITATDDCGIPVVVFSFAGATVDTGVGDASGMLLNVGETTVTYAAFDAAGNSVNCSFIVTVIQEQLSITCPTNILIGNDPGDCGATITNLELTINSAVSNIASVNYTISTFPVTTGTGSIIPSQFFELGTSIVTFNVTDIFGNTTSCSFNVTITDSEPPMIADCPTNITVSSAANCSASVNWTPPTATDNCDINVDVVGDHMPGDIFLGGITTVTYTATDDFGNISTCSFTVEVLDNEPPMIFCPANITVGTDGTITDPNNFLDPALFQMISCDSVILGFNLPQGSDNCLNWTIAQTGGLPTGSVFTTGVNTLEFTIYDAGGDSSSCEVDILVTSPLNSAISATPNPICQGEILQLDVTPFDSAANYSWSGPDNFTSNIHNPTVANLTNSGTYVVTITNSNNTCEEILSVDVTVLESPIVTVPADTIELACTDGTQDITLSAMSMSTITNWEWTNPSGVPIGNDSILIINNVDAGDAGTYTLVATGASGCTTTVTQEVIISNELLEPTITNSCLNVTCVSEPCTFFGMFGGSDPDSVLWTSNNPNVGLPADVTTNSITVNPTEGGSYTLTFTIFKDGCSVSSSDLFVVNTPALVAADQYNIELNTTTTLNVIENDVVPPGYSISILSGLSNESGTLTNNMDGTFTYNPDEGYLGTDQFVYTICIECSSGPICRFATVNLTVSSGECLVPTIITPNGDGMNDEWQISCALDEPQNELIVYNRWGDEVYRAEPYQNDWEGTYNGEDLPDGTYFYIYKNGPSDTDPRKGYLTIMR